MKVIKKKREEDTVITIFLLALLAVFLVSIVMTKESVALIFERLAWVAHLS